MNMPDEINLCLYEPGRIRKEASMTCGDTTPPFVYRDIKTNYENRQPGQPVLGRSTKTFLFNNGDSTLK
jgi:hypothetical protein